MLGPELRARRLLQEAGEEPLLRRHGIPFPHLDRAEPRTHPLRALGWLTEAGLSDVAVGDIQERCTSDSESGAESASITIFALETVPE